MGPQALMTNASLVLDDDQNNTLYVWHGGSAGLREKTKALDTANTFRSNRGQLRVSRAAALALSCGTSGAGVERHLLHPGGCAGGMCRGNAATAAPGEKGGGRLMRGPEHDCDCECRVRRTRVPQLTVMDQEDVTSPDALAFYALLGASDPAAAAQAIAAVEGPVPAALALDASGGGGGGAAGTNGAGGGEAKAAVLLLVEGGKVQGGDGSSPPSR